MSSVDASALAARNSRYSRGLRALRASMTATYAAVKSCARDIILVSLVILGHPLGHTSNSRNQERNLNHVQPIKSRAVPGREIQDGQNLWHRLRHNLHKPNTIPTELVYQFSTYAPAMSL